MSDSVLSGAPALMAKLKAIAESMGGGSVSVGFMAGATYPDGTPVAAVAFWNEYGGPNRPPRPFFRRMIAKESPDWPERMARQAKGTNYNGPKVLALMGEDIGGSLYQSINEFTTPALAQSTIDAKGFSKPLDDTANMLRSVVYQVNAGAIVPITKD